MMDENLPHVWAVLTRSSHDVMVIRSATPLEMPPVAWRMRKGLIVFWSPRQYDQEVVPRAYLSSAVPESMRLCLDNKEATILAELHENTRD